MRVVVTGASGNLGTALLRRLTAEGHSVVGISRRHPPEVAPYSAAEWVVADLAEPSGRERLVPAFRSADAVVHLAWLIQPSWNRELLRRTNQGGTRAVAEAAREAGVRHLVHLSSIGTYAAAPGRTVDETWDNSGIPTSSYSVDKAACEAFLDGFESSLAVTRVRPALVLQEDAASEISRYFLGRFVPASVLRQPVLRFGPWPADLAVQFVHADDVAAALELVLRTGATGAFNVASDPPVDRTVYRQVFGGVGPPLPKPVLRVAAELTWRLHLQPTDAGWVDLGFDLPLMDTRRVRELGWKPTRSGPDVLQSFVGALQNRRGGPGPLLYPRRVLRRFAK
jgi:nucleoside-diphosphate-sugar epimerase